MCISAGIYYIEFIICTQYYIIYNYCACGAVGSQRSEEEIEPRLLVCFWNVCSEWLSSVEVGVWLRAPSCLAGGTSLPERGLRFLNGLDRVNLSLIISPLGGQGGEFDRVI